MSPRQSEVEVRARLLAVLAQAGICRVGADGSILAADQALAEMLGYGHPDEILARQDIAALHFEREDAATVQTALASTAVATDVAARWRRRDGTLCNVRISSHVVTGTSGRQPVRELLVRDVTAQLQRDTEQRRSERMAGLGTALAGIAHELNNPLTAIMGFAQLLLNKPAAAGDRPALETIHREAARSAKVVRDLLTLTRRRDADRRAPVRLNEVVEYIVHTRRHAQHARGIHCALELERELPRVMGDRTQLEQMMLNLVSNGEQAIRAARASNRAGAGQLAIRTRADRDAVVLEVEDDGAGIPEHLRSHIWEPFWTRGSGLGVGLGLAVVHAVATDHDGHIEVTPGSRGGTRFVIRLPGLARADGESASGGEARHALDVLVADNSEAERNFLRRLLSSRGHAVLGVGATTEAVRLATRTHFDVVICSASIAGDDETLCALRGGAKTDGPSRSASPRVIVAAGSADSTARLPLPLPAGVAVVMHPYDVSELLHLLEER